MSFFSRLFAPRDPRRALAEQVIALHRAEGDARQWTYDAESFAIKEAKADGLPGDIFFLANIERDLAPLPRERAASFLRSLVAGRIQAAARPVASWAEMVKNVVPGVRARDYLETMSLQKAARGDGVLGPLSEVVPLGQFLTLGLVEDLPTQMTFLTWKRIEDLGMERERALSIAMENLERRSREDFVLEGRLFDTPWRDNHDSGRITLVERIEALPVKGRPVALVAHRDHLPITGSEDEEGLAQLVSMAEELVGLPRAEGFYPLVLSDGRWTDFTLPESHPSFAAASLLTVQSFARRHGAQAELLPKILERQKREIFVASVTAIRQQGSPRLHTASVWTRGVATLLPRTELVGLVVDIAKKDHFLVPLERLEAETGPLPDEPGLYPPRALVTAFPSEDAIERLRAQQVKAVSTPQG